MRKLYNSLCEIFEQLLSEYDNQKPILEAKLKEIAPDKAYAFAIYKPVSFSDIRIHGFFKTPDKWGPKTHAYVWSYEKECWEVWD